jgi:hypothetical protein
MHAVLAFTAMHDRFLRSPLEVGSPIAECYHNSCSATLFLEKLSSTIVTSDRCALWTTAVLLSQMAFFSVETHDPEKSWPLTCHTPPQFEWLNLQQGLRVMWKLASPDSPGGIFHELLKLPQHAYLSSKMDVPDEPGIEGIPASIVALCELTPSSNSQNNPYHMAARILASLIQLECTNSTILRFLAFTCSMQPQFKELLVRKDARAMLLLMYWYAKVCDARWWIQGRARLECKSIRIYLERYHHSEIKLMGFVASLKLKYKWLI